MEVAIKVKGVTRRWVINLIVILACVVTVLVITLSAVISNYYNDRVADYLNSVAVSFDRLSVTDSAGFAAEARLMAEQFPMKNSVEVQIIDGSGTIILSTSGFYTDEKPGEDYEQALRSSSNTANTVTVNDHNERVMSSCYILTDYNSNKVGAVRCLASMERIDRQVLIITSSVAFVGLMIILLEAFSGVFFIKSIVKPVREVSTIARKIATGDLKARIDVRDNNEVGELCDTINYMAGELEEAERLKNEFISSVSHELRTPLTAIKGWGETIQSAGPSDKELVDRGVGVIISETERLSGLVEELLDFSRMQSGRMSYRMERTDLFAELSEAVYMYQHAAAKNGITLNYAEPMVTPTVIGDAGRLKQVFINVIDNAIKYSNSGDTVTVSAEVFVSTARITVADTGIGIPDKDIEHVTEKFYKANTTVRGSGIGLAVVSEIVHFHGGELEITSEENVGTTVMITLPIETQLPHDTVAADSIS